MSRKALRRREIVRWIEIGLYMAFGIGVYVLTGLALRLLGVA